jgi:hypothetical protein
MQFRFDGGDGDQSYFSETFLADLVIEPWFPSTIERGPAYLVKVKTGSHRGEYLALTSRMVASLEEQLRVRDYLSVVVHQVRDPGPGFVASADRLPAIGMAAIEALGRTGSAILANPRKP